MTLKRGLDYSSVVENYSTGRGGVRGRERVKRMLSKGGRWEGVEPEDFNM